ncbi:hypothetical protein ACGFMK_31835 [Amycolatopsis sp. NPDC049252]|uniref:hypothetical protein n=1 Tax=Amycolatopsis sp. NPDC049252 TaxID=3363933 RepID=UPI0037235BD7
MPRLGQLVSGRATILLRSATGDSTRWTGGGTTAMKIEVDQLTEELARALFEALRLEIRYARDTNTPPAGSP